MSQVTRTTGGADLCQKGSLLTGARRPAASLTGVTAPGRRGQPMLNAVVRPRGTTSRPRSRPMRRPRNGARQPIASCPAWLARSGPVARLCRHLSLLNYSRPDTCQLWRGASGIRQLRHMSLPRYVSADISISRPGLDVTDTALVHVDGWARVPEAAPRGSRQPRLPRWRQPPAPGALAGTAAAAGRSGVRLPAQASCRCRDTSSSQTYVMPDLCSP
jgi:hypothetical protein